MNEDLGTFRESHQSISVDGQVSGRLLITKARGSDFQHLGLHNPLHIGTRQILRHSPTLRALCLCFPFSQLQRQQQLNRTPTFTTLPPAPPLHPSSPFHSKNCFFCVQTRRFRAETLKSCFAYSTCFWAPPVPASGPPQHLLLGLSSTCFWASPAPAFGPPQHLLLGFYSTRFLTWPCKNRAPAKPSRPEVEGHPHCFNSVVHRRRGCFEGCNCQH